MVADFYEKTRHKRLTKKTLARLKREGVVLGGMGYGWKRTNILDEHGRRRIELIPSEMKIVEYIWRLKYAGCSVRAITTRLNVEHVPTKMKKGQWHSTQVQRIVSSKLFGSIVADTVRQREKEGVTLR